MIQEKNVEKKISKAEIENIDNTIFGTVKFYKEKQEDKK